jgi:mannose-6-phosphate isomerase class I
VSPSGRVLEHDGPQIVLAVAGSVSLTDAQGGRLVVEPGRSVFLPARQGPVWLEGAGTLFRAKDGLRDKDATAVTVVPGSVTPALSPAS